jgi:biotin-[acetyl-CoA-carboxylase] ligase BirA-like protein
MVMADERPFDFTSAEQEIDRLKRPIKSVIWQAPKGESFTLSIPPTVYPPREDTDLLANAIVRIGAGRGKRCLEIGCGSGALSLLAARQGWKVKACDINPFAVMASRHSAEIADIDLDIQEGGPGPKEDGEINQWSGQELHDLIIWNLPYLGLPSSEDDVLGPFEEAALLDTDSIGLVSRLVKMISTGKLMTTTGMALILVSNNQRGNDTKRICLQNGLSCREFSSKQFEDGEELTVYAIWQPFSNCPVRILDEVDSTNKMLLDSGGRIGASIQAKKQLEGKGRRGRTWTSETNAFAGSWIVHDGKGELVHSDLQLVGGLAVVDAIRAISSSECHERIRLKWPNDILLENESAEWAKVAGVLLEGRSIASEIRLVLGIGANIFSAQPLEKQDFKIATLNQSLNLDIDFSQFSSVISAALSSLLEQRINIPNYPSTKLLKITLEEIKSTASSLGNPIYRTDVCEVIGLDEKGHLRLKTTSGELLNLDEGEDLIWPKYN